ncbi:Putative peptidase S53, activation domain, peptidase S8, subtilisin, Ser-active, Sedolisin [Septoria linicola]|uniref:tripeptidyl-peptidase II n=1 Tax=Septoria linicola TaxID=215465 RepID=A0A9Q9EHD0_9PEZI|nr:putative peptidase S53, activation domain, peptidase S8, subtilisin, Ser-active, Sedolisin [Septoria linicola]USW49188.1 Putative peptidase S53, activation domain, peptidase S8, subtilisin, Ser-active, Sedolisin [Septoria linicola]
MLPTTLLALLGVACAEIMESLHEVPESWTRIGTPRPEERLHLRIAMTAPIPRLFEQTLFAVSNPSNARYGQYLKRDELKDLLRPKSEATSAVMSWLVQSGVSPEAIAEDGEWINFVASVKIANDLLDTSFDIYENVRGQKRIRTLQYSIPGELHEFVDMVQPTTRFGEVRPLGSQVFDRQEVGKPQAYSRVAQPSNIQSVCDGRTVTPDCLRALYKIPDDPQVDNATSGYMAYVNYLEQYPRDVDLAEFTQDYFPRANGVTYSWDALNGEANLASLQNSPETSGEANLDQQYLLATGWPVNMHTYIVGGRGLLQPDLDQPTQADNENEPYLDWLNFVLAQPDSELPHTISTSYGENEQSVPVKYRRKVCDLFGQLGARGVSVLFASGDTGVGSACQTNDGKNRTRFMPVFPASCPYVTSVGSTFGVEPETAIAFSSGGFSETWPMPDYQRDAVQGYLNQIGNQWEGLYNPAGRAFPDVAAQGSNFHVIDKGMDTLVSGTSASAPVFAGIIALLNAQRLTAGKGTLGFLNPWIYGSAYQGLNDIISGGSSGCTGVNMYSGLQAPIVKGASWKALDGWDAVTGWGTPDYERLLPLAMAI